MKLKRFLTLITASILCLSLCAFASAEGEARTLNIASIGETTSLYPVTMVPENYTISRLCFETLVTYEHGEIVPVLAERWEISEDGRTLTLHLRQGVKFHDGSDFNAEAMKANLVDLLNGPAAYSLPAIGTCKGCVRRRRAGCRSRRSRCRSPFPWRG